MRVRPVNRVMADFKIKLDHIAYNAVTKLDQLQEEIDNTRFVSTTARKRYELKLAATRCRQKRDPWFCFDWRLPTEISDVEIRPGKIYDVPIIYGAYRIVGGIEVWEHNPDLKMPRWEQLQHNYSVDPSFRTIGKIGTSHLLIPKFDL